MVPIGSPKYIAIFFFIGMGSLRSPGERISTKKSQHIKIQTQTITPPFYTHLNEYFDSVIVQSFYDYIWLTSFAEISG